MSENTVGPAPVERGGATSVANVGGAGPTQLGVDLCRKVMLHAAFSSHTANRTAGEVRQAISVLFSQQEIDAAMLQKSPQ